MVTRRAVLGAAIGGAGLLGAARIVGAHPAAVGGPTTTGAPVPVASGLLDGDPIAHLVRRLACAPTSTLVDRVTDTGVDAWLDAQLAPADEPAGAGVRAVLDELAVETMSAGDFVAAHRAARAAREERRASDEVRDVAAARELPPPGVELAASLLVRRVAGDQHLLESMVELWSDVLHVHIGHDAITQLFTPFLVRDVLRPHALGSFDDLLVAVTTSPAMLHYLDGARSRAGAVNENHARELLELHTVGVDAHDEHDVAAAAQVLTGWVVDPRSGTARLVPRRHDGAVVDVLDWTGSGDEDDAEDLLRHLARHPATASRVARALAVRFVADNPPDGLVDDLAATYLAADTAIAPVLRALVESPAFAGAAGQKLRRPMAFATTALAAVGGDTPLRLGRGSLRAVGEGLVALGHTPLGWPAPNGYPDVAPAWVSSAAALGRWGLATAIADTVTDRSWPDAAAVLDDLPSRLLLAPLPTSVRDELLAAAGAADDPVVAATALVLDLPATHLR